VGIAARIRLAPATAAESPSAAPWAIGALLAIAALAWVATVVRMAGMDAGPGTDPGSLGFYLSTWTVMMAAMMLPSAAPAVLAYSDQVSRHGGVATAWFAAGYLLLWAVSGLLGYALLDAGRSLAPGAFAWHHAGRWVAASVLLVAAAYELTPAKRACLVSCRGHRADRPVRRGQPGTALRAGVRYGGRCIGCCWAMMVALFALGAMSLVWMALITVLIGAQKLLPWTRASLIGAALVLLALAVGLAVAASSVPGLTVPGGSSAMHMMMC
jgi:predicted metal-binding membrane protein